MKVRYIQDSQTGKLVKIGMQELIPQRSAFVPKEFQEFQSTLDGSIISDAGQLAKHNRRNGVTNSADYSQDYYAKRGAEMHNMSTGNNAQAKAERLELIRNTVDQYQR